MDVIKEFKKFLLRGSLIDLAIGFTVGASFSTVARSLVDDILMPPISAISGDRDFSDLFVVLRNGNPSAPYQSRDAASSAGAITLDYGEFLTNVFTLLIVALAMFAVIKMVNKLESGLGVFGKKQNKEKNDDPANKKCPFCYSTIDFKATRCPNCTSRLETPETNIA